MADRRRRWRFPPRTIRGLAVTFAVASALVTTLLGATSLVVVHREIERQIDERIEAESNALLDYEHDFGFDALVAVVRLRDKRSGPGTIGYLAGVDDGTSRSISYIVTDKSGRRVAGSLRSDMPPPGWSEFLHIRRADGSRGDAQVLNSGLRSGGRLVVAGDRAMLHRTDRMLFKLFATAFGALLVLGGVMVLAFGRIVSRRLADLENSAKLIMAGDLSRRLPLDGSGIELDRLSQLLNRLLDHIAKLVNDVRTVSDGIAHDLRTPLSRVRAKLEMSLGMATDQKQRGLLDGAMADSDALLSLFGSMLAITEIDGHRIRGRFQRLDLAAAVTEIAEAHRPALEDTGIALEVAAAPVYVCGDKSLLQRLVSNLLDNVICHAKGASLVRVTVAEQQGSAVLLIHDNGPGIPASERTRVFERLVRLEASRSTAGHGLGLNMVSAIVSAHEGHIQILEMNGFAIELRLTPDRQAS